MCSITHLYPIDAAAAPGNNLVAADAEALRPTLNKLTNLHHVRIFGTCADVQRGAGVSSSGGGDQGKQWRWSVMVCSRVMYEGSGQFVGTDKGSGQARSASVSGVVGTVWWCTHS